MFYRLLLNYFRLKMIRVIFAKLMRHQKVQKSSKVLKLLSFLELFVTQYLNKKRSKKV